MKEYQKYFWTGIFLFWLIFPPIILFVKYIKYIIALNEVKVASPDQDLQKGFTLLIVGLLLNFTHKIILDKSGHAIEMSLSSGRAGILLFPSPLGTTRASLKACGSSKQN